VTFFSKPLTDYLIKRQPHDLFSQLDLTFGHLKVAWVGLGRSDEVSCEPYSVAEYHVPNSIS